MKNPKIQVGERWLYSDNNDDLLLTIKNKCCDDYWDIYVIKSKRKFFEGNQNNWSSEYGDWRILKNQNKIQEI